VQYYESSFQFNLNVLKAIWGIDNRHPVKNTSQ